MKLRYAIGALFAAASLAVLVACGGGDDGGGASTSGIRTQKGLAVAALTEGLAGSGSQQSDTSVPAPAADRQAGGGGGGTATGYDSAIAPQDSTRFGGAPLLQQGTDGITVQGYGSATADADSAIIELYFSRNGPVGDISSGSSEPGFPRGAEPAPPEAQEVAPITDERASIV